MYNKKLFASRIKTGEKWMQHLPNAFHDELIAALFLEIDKNRAVKVMQAYHNKHLRMRTEDSSAFKTFVGLNAAEYIRLSRVPFYYAGMQFLHQSRLSMKYEREK